MAAYRDEDDFLEQEWAPQGGDNDSDDWDDESHDEEDLINCPECGASIHAESEQCSACGYYIPHEPASSHLWKGRSWWWLLLGGLGIAAVIYALSQP